MLTEWEHSSTEWIENGYGRDTEQIKNRNGGACGAATECLLPCWVSSDWQM